MDDPVSLDKRRGMIALKEIEDRRLLAGARAHQAELAEHQAAYEDSLLSSAPETPQDAVRRAIYLLKLQIHVPGLNPRRARLIAQTLAGLEEFFADTPSS